MPGFAEDLGGRFREVVTIETKWSFVLAETLSGYVGKLSKGCGSDFRASLKNVQATFFVLPDCPNPAKSLAVAASGGEDGGC